MDRAEMLEMLRQSLQIRVVTDEAYNGGMSGSRMYDETKTIQILFDGEVISEDSL